MKLSPKLTVPTIILLGFMLGSCQNQSSQDSSDEATIAVVEAPAFAVNVLPVSLAPLSDYIRVNGEVRSTSTVDAYPDVNGKLVRVLVSLGEYVESGQVLVEVDPSRPGMEFVLSQVKAPISGTVTALPISAGSTISQQTPVARISRTGDIEVITSVAERFVSRMRLGLKVELGFESFQGEKFFAKVTGISPILDPLSRSLEIKIRLNRPDSRIRPGMFARVKLITVSKAGVVVVPSESLVRRFGVVYVFVVEDGKSKRVVVNPGIEIDGLSEIPAGLKEGEQIVIRGQTLLEDGSRVRIAEIAQPLSSSEKE